MASPVDKFFAKYNNKPVRFSGSSNSTPQCTDLAAQYNKEVVGAPNVSDGNGAKDWWPNASRTYYTPMANTPSFVPRRGDIAVWSAALGNTWGHVAVCTGEGNVNYFVSMDQNWGGQYAHYVRHDYKAIAGFLRPKKDVNFDQEAYDKAQAALKAAADAKARAEAEAKLLVEAQKKAEADRIAKEQAMLIANEQKRIAAEQAKLEAERLAKIEEENNKKGESMLEGYKTYIGIGVALLGALGVAKFFGGQDQMTQYVDLLVQLVGLSIAAYGRFKAKI